MVTNCELANQALLSGDLNYLDNDEQMTLLDKILEFERMLMVFILS